MESLHPLLRMPWDLEPARTIPCRICNTKLSEHFPRLRTVKTKKRTDFRPDISLQWRSIHHVQLDVHRDRVSVWTVRIGVLYLAALGERILGPIAPQTIDFDTVSCPGSVTVPNVNL